MADSGIKCDFGLVKAKALIKLQRRLPSKSYGTSSLPLYEAAVVALNKSLGYAIAQGDLATTRDIYYLLARLYEELSLSTKRDQAALLFLQADQDILLHSKHRLGYICHYDLGSLIDSEIEYLATCSRKYKVLD